MKLANRAIDWSTASAEQAAQTVRFSDSSPGCPHTIGGIKYRIFGAYSEGGGATSEVVGDIPSGPAPGEPVGEKQHRAHSRGLLLLLWSSSSSCSLSLSLLVPR